MKDCPICQKLQGPMESEYVHSFQLESRMKLARLMGNKEGADELAKQVIASTDKRTVLRNEFCAHFDAAHVAGLGMKVMTAGGGM